jgi:hypothetical protein
VAARSIFVLNPTICGVLTLSGAANAAVARAVDVESNSATAILVSGNARRSSS